MSLSYLLLLIAASFLLIYSTDRLILHLKHLDSRIKLGGFAITGVFLALATSLPELFVGVTAALEGSPEVALGNIVGSNIANLSVVAGLAAVIGGTLKIENGSTKEDLLHAFVGGALPLVLLYDKVLSRAEALVLIGLYALYNYTILSKRQRGFEKEDEGFVHKLLRRLRPARTQVELGLIFFYTALILVLADLIVRLSRAAALNLHIPLFLIGLFIVGLGTSLPELAFELAAVRKGEASMFMGNLIGSIVANGTLIIGITALIRPIEVAALGAYLLASVFFVCLFFLFYFFIRTKHKLERWEGGVLMLVFLLFLLLELL